MPSVFPNSPYQNKFTKAEVAELTKRGEALADVLRDAVTPNGDIMGIPEDWLQMACLHGAIAGIPDPDPAKAFIVKRPAKNPIYEGAVEWVWKADAPPEPAPQGVEAEAEKYATAMEEQLSPEVRALIAKRLITASKEAQED